MIPDNQTKANPQPATVGVHFLRMMRKVKRRYFSKYGSIVKSTIKDPRASHSRYSLEELIWAGIVLFGMRHNSRNSLNNFRKTGKFSENYEKFFGYRLPHMDAVNYLLKKGVDEKQLERLHIRFLRDLISKKVFHPYRELEEYYVVAVDATGVVSFDHPHCDQCLKRTSKNGITTWFHNVLEARLIGRNGFSIPLMSEWISNDNDKYEKQDSELKAFKRLASRLKKSFKRTKFLIIADGLYTNGPFMTICKQNRWQFTVTLKPKSLPSVWEEMNSLRKLNPPKTLQVRDKHCECSYHSCDIQYQDHLLRFAQCQEINKKTLKSTTYSYLCSLRTSVTEIVRCGRLRQKIENEGFNAAKNHGYALKHLFSRDFSRLRCYHLLRSIATVLMQLTMLSKKMWHIRKACKFSWAHIYRLMKASLCYVDLDRDLAGPDPPYQIRYDFRKT